VDVERIDLADVAGWRAVARAAATGEADDAAIDLGDVHDPRGIHGLESAAPAGLPPRGRELIEQLVGDEAAIRDLPGARVHPRCFGRVLDDAAPDADLRDARRTSPRYGARGRSGSSACRRA